MDPLADYRNSEPTVLPLGWLPHRAESEVWGVRRSPGSHRYRRHDLNGRQAPETGPSSFFKPLQPPPYWCSEARLATIVCTGVPPRFPPA